MANNSYVVEYATTGRASCKAKLCRKIIDKGDVRIGKRFPSARFTEDGEATDWFHPKCIFETLARAKKTTKRIGHTSDMQGYGSLEHKDQKMLQDYISGKIAIAVLPKKQKDPNAISSPKPKKIKAPGAVKPKSSSKKNTQAKVEKAWAIRDSDGKRTELPIGGTFFGRGADSGIDDKRCSRSQLEVSVTPGNVTVRANGANPSILYRKGGAKEVLAKGVDYDLDSGDAFCVLLDQYRFTVHVQREGAVPKPKPAAASLASPSKKRPKSDSEGSGDDVKPVGKPKLAKISDDEEGASAGGASDGVPLCTCCYCGTSSHGNRQYGKACFRKNPQHFLEFAHPWRKKDDE